MKSTFANAGENLSDEQLKHVTGGAGVNSRPEAPEDHLIDHGNLDLHGVAAADGYWRPTHPGPTAVIEKIQFSGPVTVPGLQDGSGRAITIDQIDIFSNGEVCAVHDIPEQPGQREIFDLGNYEHEHDGASLRQSQTIVDDAAAQGDQISVTGPQDLPVSLPGNG
jgi:hypothetical protein